jgi:hypothetical protein
MRHRIFDPILDAQNSLRNRQDVAQFFAGPIYFDRAVQGAAKKAASTSADTATGYGSTAAQIGSSLIPGLEQQAQHPTGYDPTQKNNMLVASQEAVGGSGSGITGQANLEAARTRNAGGFARALDEAQRKRGRQLSSNALGIENEDARIGLQRQNEAQRMLAGLYGTDTSNQLKAMGLENEDLNTALEAGKSGWQQNAMNWINTITGAAKAFKPGGGGGSNG